MRSGATGYGNVKVTNEGIMRQETLEVQGTVQPDGSLVLDQKLKLPAGRVRVTVEPCSESTKPNVARFLALMEEIWAGQRTRGHVARTKEEIDAEIDQIRQDSEEEMQALERLHQDCQRQQPGATKQ
jgi:hypothetical protein